MPQPGKNGQGDRRRDSLPPPDTGTTTILQHDELRRSATDPTKIEIPADAMQSKSEPHGIARSVNDFYYSAMSKFHGKSKQEVIRTYASSLLEPHNEHKLHSILHEMSTTKEHLGHFEEDKQKVLEFVIMDLNRASSNNPKIAHYRLLLSRKLISGKLDGITPELKEERERRIAALIQWDPDSLETTWGKEQDKQESVDLRAQQAENLLRGERPDPRRSPKLAQAYDHLVDRVMSDQELLSWQAWESAQAYLLDRQEHRLSENLQEHRRYAIKALFLPHEELEEPEEEEKRQKEWNGRYQAWRERYKKDVIGESFPDDPTDASETQIEHLVLSQKAETVCLPEKKWRSIKADYIHDLINRDEQTLSPDLQDTRWKCIQELALLRQESPSEADRRNQDLAVSALFRDTSQDGELDRIDKTQQLLNKDSNSLSASEIRQRDMALVYLTKNFPDPVLSLTDHELKNIHRYDGPGIYDQWIDSHYRAKEYQEQGVKELLQRDPATLPLELQKIQQNIIDDLVFHPDQHTHLRAEREKILATLEAKAIAEYQEENCSMPQQYQSVYEQLPSYLLDYKIELDESFHKLYWAFNDLRAKTLYTQAEYVREHGQPTDTTMQQELFERDYKTTITNITAHGKTPVWLVDVHKQTDDEKTARPLYKFVIAPETGNIWILQPPTSTYQDRELSFPRIIRNSVEKVREKYEDWTGDKTPFILRKLTYESLDSSAQQAINILTDLPSDQRELRQDQHLNILFGAKSLQDCIYLSHYFPRLSESAPYAVPHEADIEIDIKHGLTYAMLKAEEGRRLAKGQETPFRYKLTIYYKIPRLKQSENLPTRNKKEHK